MLQSDPEYPKGQKQLDPTVMPPFEPLGQGGGARGARGLDFICSEFLCGSTYKLLRSLSSVSQGQLGKISPGRPWFGGYTRDAEGVLDAGGAKRSEI